MSLRDLEPLIVFFVAWQGLNREDEHFRRMSRAFSSFCQNATLVLHMAQTMILDEKKEPSLVSKERK